MKTMMMLMLTSVMTTLALGGSANGYSSSLIDETSCQVHTAETCHEPGDGWAQGPCHSVYGGFRGNSDALHKVMLEHFQDSFKYLVMGSHFSSDEVNRLGMHNLMGGLSDKMWSRGKDTMKYILKRGGRMGSHFKIEDVRGADLAMDEVESLASALDGLKDRAETVSLAHKHANNKKVHEAGLSHLDSYDPDVAHFYEDLLEDYSGEIREMAGYLNILAKIARSDNTRSMGLYFFDQHLK